MFSSRISEDIESKGIPDNLRKLSQELYGVMGEAVNATPVDDPS